MLKDGFYFFDFGTLFGAGSARVEMKDGQFSGTTHAGVAVAGTCEFVASRQMVRYEMEVFLPPHHMAVTGLTAGPEGRRIIVSGEKSLGESGQRFSFGLAGRAVDVAMRYEGPSAT